MLYLILYFLIMGYTAQKKGGFIAFQINLAVFVLLLLNCIAKGSFYIPDPDQIENFLDIFRLYPDEILVASIIILLISLIITIMEYREWRRYKKGIMYQMYRYDANTPKTFWEYYIDGKRY